MSSGSHSHNGSLNETILRVIVNIVIPALTELTEVVVKTERDLMNRHLLSEKRKTRLVHFCLPNRIYDSIGKYSILYTLLIQLSSATLLLKRIYLYVCRCLQTHEVLPKI